MKNNKKDPQKMSNNIDFSYPIIDTKATGENIRKLQDQRKMTVKKLQQILNLESEQSIYKWYRGASIPSLDNLVALSSIFEVKIDDILVVQKKSA